MAQDNVSLLLKSTGYLVVAQVSSRLITFGLNLVVARWLSSESYGLAAVQFHLINTTILFLSREGFRRGCLHTKPDSSGRVRAAPVLATAALSLPLGALITAAVCGLALRGQHEEYADVAAAVIALQGGAALLELLSEPLYILAQTRLAVRLRVAAETAAQVAKSGITLLLLARSTLHPAIVLSLAQAAYGGTVLLAYLAHFLPEWWHWVRQRRRQPNRPGAAKQAVAQRQALLEPQLLWLCGGFAVQAAEKHALAEGSKLVLVQFESAGVQGVYGLVSNLGSMVVRTFFQPVEESANLVFSRAAAAGRAEGGPSMEQRRRMLAILVRGMSVLGLLAAAFGPSYAYVVLRLLYGLRWSETDAPHALAVYSCYLVLLAVNGILEAFVHGVAHSREVTNANLALLVCSLVHMGASVLALRYGGAAGLIGADALNMVLRIAYCCHFVTGHFQELPSLGLADFFPARQSLKALGAAFLLTGFSSILLMSPASSQATWLGLSMSGFYLIGPLFSRRAVLHILLGATTLAAVLFRVYRGERHVFQEIRHMREPNKKD